MPELPEVETTRAGIAPLIEGKQVSGIELRAATLRQPLDPALKRLLPGQCVRRVWRRGKYLILTLDRGSLLIHLGMSGSLRFVRADLAAEKHDHVDLVFGGHCLRLRDPRKFGTLLWTRDDPLEHRLLRHLGPEPLSDAFDADWLHARSRGRRLAIKSFIMNGQTVVGVGNIYANEALFAAGIQPKRACGRISRVRYQLLVGHIKRILQAAIEQGGTTLRDFQNEQGQPGYFAQQLQVYGRAGKPCPNCARPISQTVIGQRSSYYCAHCQR